MSLSSAASVESDATDSGPVDRFVWERAVLADRTLTPGARVLAFTLAVRMDARTGKVPARYSPSRARLLREIGLSDTAGGVRAFYRYRAELVAAGLLHVVEGVGRGRPARYQAGLPADSFSPVSGAPGGAAVAKSVSRGSAASGDLSPAVAEASPAGAVDYAPAGSTPMSFTHTEGNNPPPSARAGVAAGPAAASSDRAELDVEEILRNVTAEHAHLVDALSAPVFARDFVPAMHAILEAMPVSEAGPIRDGLMLRTLDAWRLLARTVADAHRCGLASDLVSYTTAATGSSSPYAGVRDPARAWAKRVLTWDQMRKDQRGEASRGLAGWSAAAPGMAR